MFSKQNPHPDCGLVTIHHRNSRGQFAKAWRKEGAPNWEGVTGRGEGFITPHLEDVTFFLND
jgi:hypothetical protein